MLFRAPVTFLLLPPLIPPPLSPLPLPLPFPWSSFSSGLPSSSRTDTEPFPPELNLDLPYHLVLHPFILPLGLLAPTVWSLYLINDFLGVTTSPNPPPLLFADLRAVTQ